MTMKRWSHDRADMMLYGAQIVVIDCMNKVLISFTIIVSYSLGRPLIFVIHSHLLCNLN
jgi:hypothetical protein